MYKIILTKLFLLLNEYVGLNKHTKNCIKCGSKDLRERKERKNNIYK